MSKKDVGEHYSLFEKLPGAIIINTEKNMEDNMEIIINKILILFKGAKND